MDLSSLASAVKKYAPLVGTALGGPAGGAIGGLVSVVASAFGVDPDQAAADPDILKAAIEKDPAAAVKLKEIESNQTIELQRMILAADTAKIESETRRLQSVNETMRTESQSEHMPQWLWRPLWGIISAAAFFVVCCFVCYLAYRAIVEKDSTAFGQIPLVIGAFTSLFGIPGAILGITAWGRNRLKETQQCQALPMR